MARKSASLPERLRGAEDAATGEAFGAAIEITPADTEIILTPKAAEGASANIGEEGTFPDLANVKANDVRNRTPAVLGTANGHATAAVFRLPLPPSVNRLWRIGRKGGKVGGKPMMYKSAHYARWRSQAAWIIKAGLGATKGLPGAYSLRVRAVLPTDRGHDLENLTKALGDALQDSGVIRNDKLNKKFDFEWIPGIDIGQTEGMEVLVMQTSDLPVAANKTPEAVQARKVAAAKKRTVRKAAWPIRL